MAENILHDIPADLVKFFIVTLFSLLIGLEQRRVHIDKAFGSLFGTDRTFTLIGILGYILYIISPLTLVPFLCGGGAVALMLGVYYYQKIKVQQLFGITSLIIALITYSLAPLVYTQPLWMALLIVLLVLVLTEVKETLFLFSEKFGNDEFITLAKFLVIAGVLVPLLPDKPISAAINISPYKFSLTIVAVSGISYLSYLLKKFVFPQSGIILTGILGGLYSSTATTFILARKSKEMPDTNKAAAAILLATTMMYLRLFVLACFFNLGIAMHLLPSFAICAAASALTALYYAKFAKTTQAPTGTGPAVEGHSNPLEIKTALVFAVLFIFFSFVTTFVTNNYGTGGLNVLSFVVGVTDIDPFIINLFQGKWNMADTVLVTATLNAISSNNLLKMIYGISLSGKAIRMKLIIGYGILIVLGLLFAFVVHF